MLETVDLSEWTELDLAVANSTGSNKIAALMGARRLSEAYKLVQELEDETHESLDYWSLRAMLAQQHGDEVDATKCVCKARALNSEWYTADWTKDLVCVD